MDVPRIEERGLALGRREASGPNRLLPEEDAIGDPDEEDDGQDDTLPADLWY